MGGGGRGKRIGQAGNQTNSFMIFLLWYIFWILFWMLCCSLKTLLVLFGPCKYRFSPFIEQSVLVLSSHSLYYTRFCLVFFVWVVLLQGRL